MLCSLEGTSFKVIMHNENQTEISFTRKWDSTSSLAPLNIDKRYLINILKLNLFYLCMQH